MKPRQIDFRFSTEPDPSYCAHAHCRQMRVRPTHLLTFGGYTFRLCRDHAMRWEVVKSARIEPLQKKEAA